MTRDEVSEVRSTLSPDQETGAASASVCCVCQCSAQRSALPSLSRCARPRPLKTRPGPPVLLSSVSTGAPRVLTLTRPGLRVPGGSSMVSWSDGDTGHVTPPDLSTWSHTRLQHTSRIIRLSYNEYFAIFVPDTPTWYHGK